MTAINQKLEKATKINLFDFKSVHMRTFHLTWLAFFLCFFGWFSHAPLMKSDIMADIGITKADSLIAFVCSVGITIFARLYIGGLCDKIGPRKAYVYLLIFGSIAVASSAFAYNWPTYLISRMAIGVIGASFVITQYHTSVMFAPNVVGIANATSAGWGNLGGGVTQAVMPLLVAAITAFGFNQSGIASWRFAMFIPAVIMLVVAYLYWKYTTDIPKGNYSDLPAERPQKAEGEDGLFMSAAKDKRVWILFAMYAGCFGMELFVNGKAATYYQESFGLTPIAAGGIASLFGLMNLFARSLGGWLGDKFSKTSGLQGRVKWLVVVMIIEGAALILFSRMDTLGLAIITMIIFSLFVQMAEGATYSVVPFINRKALGAVAGIVGAGGNVGAVCYAQFKLHTGTPLEDCFLYFGLVIMAIGFLGFGVKFSKADEDAAVKEQEKLEAMQKEIDLQERASKAKLKKAA